MKDVQHIFWFYLFFLLCYHVETKSSCDCCPCHKRNQKTDNIKNSTARSYDSNMLDTEEYKTDNMHNSTAPPDVSNTLHTKEAQYSFRVALVYNDDNVCNFFRKAIKLAYDEKSGNNIPLITAKDFILKKHPNLSYQVAFEQIAKDVFQKKNGKDILRDFDGVIYLFRVTKKEEVEEGKMYIRHLHYFFNSTLYSKRQNMSNFAYGVFFIEHKTNDDNHLKKPKGDIITLSDLDFSNIFPKGSFVNTVVKDTEEFINSEGIRSTFASFLEILIKKKKSTNNHN